MNPLKSDTKQKAILATVVVVLVVLMVLILTEDRIKIVDKSKVLMRSSTSSYKTRNLDQITRLIIHHSASIGQRAEDYARYHVQSREWPGIGYQFVIERDGTIVQCHPLNVVSYNTAGLNTSAIGICLSGNFDQQEPSAAQLASLKKLVKHLQKKLPNQLAISGHRDHGATSCPGDALYAYLQQHVFTPILV